jgi:hypothetical protein
MPDVIATKFAPDITSLAFDQTRKLLGFAVGLVFHGRFLPAPIGGSFSVLVRQSLTAFPTPSTQA